MRAFIIVLLATAFFGLARASERVVDIPTRSGVTQRFLLISPPEAKAAVILFAGGEGGLRINPNGELQSGRGNFLIRSAPLFVEQQLAVAMIDAPSDRQTHPFLSGFRHTAEHAADVKAVIAWLRENTKLPVWLIGTSRGTQSAASAATRLQGGDGPNGIVLTATVVNDGREIPVTDMPVDTLKIPVLVVHHEQDECRVTLFRDVPRLMGKLKAAPRKELVTFRGGDNHGPRCEPMAYHGFNGLEKDVVQRIAAWMTAK